LPRQERLWWARDKNRPGIAKAHVALSTFYINVLLRGNSLLDTSVRGRRIRMRSGKQGGRQRGRRRRRRRNRNALQFAAHVWAELIINWTMKVEG
jgi:hypothetical protein